MHLLLRVHSRESDLPRNRQKRHITEFKAKAVDLLDTGKPVPQVTEELRISSALFYGP